MKSARRKSNPRTLASKTGQRQAKFALNLASGKFPTPRSAMDDAGYSKTTPVSSVLSRPLVKSELTEAMARIGLTHEMIVRPIMDGLKATRSFVCRDGTVINSDLPDHKYRLEASRDAVAIFGGIPKVGEGTPNAHGLNLFIAIDNQGGTRVETSTHAMRTVSSHKNNPTELSRVPSNPPSISIQVQDQGPRNRQAGQPDPALND